MKREGAINAAFLQAILYETDNGQYYKIDEYLQVKFEKQYRLVI